MHAAVDEMGSDAGFRGYGPEQGYDFLIDLIREHDYAARGVEIARDEIFVSDGSKCDSGNFQEIFATGNVVALTDPVYPVYVDTNVMAGRTGAAGDDGRYAGIVYMPTTAENDFTPGAAASSTPTSSTCARRTTRPAPSPPGRSSRAGCEHARKTGPSSCSTPPTRRSSPTPRCRARSTRSKARARSRSSSAASRRRRASPARAAPSPSCPRRSTAQTEVGRAGRV